MTPRQRDVLEFVSGSIRRYGYAPSQREIARGLGMAVGHVNNVIGELVRDGALIRHRRSHRGLELPPPAMCPHCGKPIDGQETRDHEQIPDRK